MLFLAKIHLKNGVITKMFGNYGERVNITMGLNVDDAIFKMGIIILASQSVLAVFFCKMLCAKPEKKHDIDIYIDGKDITVLIWISMNKYQSQWYRQYRYAALQSISNNRVIPILCTISPSSQHNWNHTRLSLHKTTHQAISRHAGKYGNHY